MTMTSIVGDLHDTRNINSLSECFNIFQAVVTSRYKLLLFML